MMKSNGFLILELSQEHPQSVKELEHEGINKDQGGKVSKTAQSKKSRAPVWVLTARAVNIDRSSGEGVENFL